MIGYRFFQKISGTNLRNADQKKKGPDRPCMSFIITLVCLEIALDHVGFTLMFVKITVCV
jgi:hypothetical protein